MSARHRVGAAVAATALLLLVGRGIAAAALDYQWYAAMGAVTLWRVRAFFTLLSAGVTAVLGTAFVFANLYAVRGSVLSLVLPRRVGNLEIGEEVPPRYLFAATAILSMLLGAVLTETDWVPLARLAYGESFGESDPYFQRDLGFFAYWLPVERSVYLWALLSVLLVTAVVVFLYALTPSLRWERGALRVSQYVRRHLTVLATLLLVLLAWSYRLDAFSLLSNGSGEAHAFSYVDHRVLVPASVVLSILTLGGALVVLWAGWTGQVRVCFGTVSGLLLLSLVLHQLAPTLARRFASEQDPTLRERPYLATRAAYTRRAFALERIGSAADTNARLDVVLARDVPSWDDVAIIRAMRHTRAGVLVPSVATQALPDGAVVALVITRAAMDTVDDWSATRVSLTRVDERGEPVAVDASGTPSDDWIRLAPVYVSDSGDGYRIVGDSTGTIAGVPIGDGLGRLVPAWALQNFRLLTRDLPQPAPRIMLHRDVRERVYAIAPFFEQGAEAVPALAGDTLLWMLDLYATAPDYPLSMRVRLGGAEHPFLHHAAVAIVNATSGRVRVVSDSTRSARDPIVRSWRHAFPELFTEARTLPGALLAQLPPALEQTMAQRVAFGAVGTNREGTTVRHPPPQDGADTAFDVSVSRFSSGAGALAVGLPLLGADERVDGLLVATAGRVPTTRWIPVTGRARWTSVLDRLRATDSSSSSALRDSRAVRGPLRTVPVAGEAAFVQSMYAWRGQGAVSLAGVGVVQRDSARWGRSLADAVGAPPPPADINRTPIEFRARAAALYDSLRASMRRGDWRAYAEHWDALGRLLGRQR